MKRSLVLRVALAAAVAAALGGALAAVSAGVAADRFVEAADDRALLGAASELADEVHEELHGAHDDSPEDELESLDDELADELSDLGLAGGRSAVFLDGERIAGELRTTPPPVGECATVRDADEALRSCTTQDGAVRVVVASSAGLHIERRPLFVQAAVLGALLGALAGAAVSVMIARWAMRPLARLQSAVATVSPNAPSSDALGAPAGYTEIDALHRTLADVLDRLGASLAHAQQFAGHAAHELRTPLAAVVAELDLLGERPLDRDVAESAARARRTAYELTQLVERLLLLAAPAQPERYGPEAVDLADVVDEAVSLVGVDQRSRLQVRADEDVLVRGDARLLRAMVQNGLDNALKYSREAVEVVVRTENDSALIEIADRGPGVPPEERARVFDAFYRAPAQNRVRGHGLGLALVAHVALLHGGTAEIDSVAGPTGACLRVRLPVWAIGEG